jgi:CheY-like chemotaxis protein
MPVLFDQHSILLVDDEDFSRNLVSQMLWRCGFGEVIVAENGYRAIELLNTRRITALLTDFRMPGIHGLQLLKKIRVGETRAPRNLVCAMITSHAERHLVGLAMVLDIDAFLAKPVSLEALNRRLGRAFQYRFEPLEVRAYESVDVDNAAPHLTGRVIPLEPAPPPMPEPPPEPTTKMEEYLPEEEPAAPPAKPAHTGPPGKRKEPSRRDEAKVDVGSPSKPGKTKPAAKRIKQVSLDDIPENAVLARDLVGAGGTLLLAAGTPFRTRYLKRLEDLRSIDQAIEKVWIFEE